MFPFAKETCEFCWDATMPESPMTWRNGLRSAQRDKQRSLRRGPWWMVWKSPSKMHTFPLKWTVPGTLVTWYGLGLWNIGWSRNKNGYHPRLLQKAPRRSWHNEGAFFLNCIQELGRSLIRLHMSTSMHQVKQWAEKVVMEAVANTFNALEVENSCFASTYMVILMGFVCLL